jgi:hypothetical protein
MSQHRWRAGKRELVLGSLATSRATLPVEDSEIKAP